jgi:hypothetical protein
MRRAVLTLIVVLGVACAAKAQTPASDAPPYRPGLGDLMTMTVQPRHIKLGLAGREKNWPYATYELAELQESLNRAALVRPRYRDFAVAETMQTLTQEPMAALAEAIKAADSGRFAQAYGKLTDACNLCHQSAGRGVIVIQVPQASPYPDQNFQPDKR